MAIMPATRRSPRNRPEVFAHRRHPGHAIGVARRCGPMEASLDLVDDIGLALQPTYRIDQSFEWNAKHGPTFAAPYPEVPETPLKDFFGLPVKSRFGLAASLGMTADWIGLYARLGFDILTYKTVRGRVRHAHAPPNWIFLDETGLALDQIERPCRTIAGVPATPGLATAA